ncbi:MAG: hypothetical protein B6D63_04835 [Candidatus Latescibacteria bacterium 4484_7]|nr:MAG: hypothetical protein B6D63_04835 [Candidatus Latescibacteria bacterium 4484_7]RKZ06051.1 MAG: hypothetical protein DRQ05_05400 [bacterium]
MLIEPMMFRPWGWRLELIMKWIKSADGFLKKYLPLVILAVMVVGFLLGLGFSKHQANVIKALIMPSVIIMIYAMLITMKMEDLKDALVFPKEMIYGSVMSLLIAPLLMLPMAHWFTSNPQQFAGLVLAGIVPPGGMITYWTGILHSNLGLATAIQTVTLLVSLIWVPYGMKWFVGSEVNVNIGLMLNKILIMIVLPLVLALITQKLITRREGWKGIVKIKPLSHMVSSIMALFMVFVATSVKAPVIARNPAVIYMPAIGVFLYYLVAYPFAFFLSSRVFKMPFENSIPVTYGFATKNLSIAMGLAAAAFGPMTFLGVVPCALFQMPFASVWYKVFTRYHARKKAGMETVAE